MTTRFLARCLAPLLALASAAAMAATPEVRFDIARFQVEGNTLLTPAQIDQRVAALAGPGRAYGDIQSAVEALQDAYREAGYTTVTVSLPEQELTGGVVRIQVTERVIASVTVTGNQHFDADNIRASVAPLQVGRAPVLRAISESIQLANDNPAKQIGVTLAEGAAPGTIDAKVAVTDYQPLRLTATLDNSGTPATGRWRAGVALQDANLFDRDQVGTLAYTTSPGKPNGVQMDLYSFGYRIPFYGIGDSLDFVYGKSNTNAPAASPTLGGVLGFTGKGDVFGVRWNHFLGRDGESFAKLVLGLDHKNIDSRCSVGGQQVSIDGPTPPIASCVPYQTTPLSLTYFGQRDGIDQSLSYSAGVSRNIPSGKSFTNIDGRTDRYSYLTSGNRDTRDGFMAVNGAASFSKAFAGGWQARLAGVAQYSHSPLVSSEQFSLTGAALVRGFEERAVAADSGLVVNAELYTPELAGLAGIPGQLRLLAFVDAGHGNNNRTEGTVVPRSVNVSSAGVGMRYVWTRDFGLRLDVARVLDAGNSATEKRGDWRAQFSAVLSY
ncbi:ShlB/FhaC/HecB family hemolysin secretion/activation protein [Variovorax sp. PBL-E5]|uniref:ShlB/FhaC/HecB family hemolysin secretion/activation protein n=1 Tax=Variovorax sp. PBL-E5 TaxID=434014 RepID=UPI001E5E9AAF|nr:ShlB/FhaC/HecB family hemolysin secretion/activation protein [Variovorax sp. PBL-E5]